MITQFGPGDLLCVVTVTLFTNLAFETVPHTGQGDRFQPLQTLVGLPARACRFQTACLDLLDHTADVRVHGGVQGVHGTAQHPQPRAQGAHGHTEEQQSAEDQGLGPGKDIQGRQGRGDRESGHTRRRQGEEGGQGTAAQKTHVCLHVLFLVRR